MHYSCDTWLCILLYKSFRQALTIWDSCQTNKYFRFITFTYAIMNEIHIVWYFVIFFLLWERVKFWIQNWQFHESRRLACRIKFDRNPTIEAEYRENIDSEDNRWILKLSNPPWHVLVLWRRWILLVMLKAETNEVGDETALPEAFRFCDIFIV